jgi:hypothetical protein
MMRNVIKREQQQQQVDYKINIIDAINTLYTLCEYSHAADDYLFTGIFPDLSTCSVSLQWAFCRNLVTEPLVWDVL